MAGRLREPHYRRVLLALLVPAAFFDGFDGELRALLLPQLRDSFHVSLAAIGLSNLPIAGGQFLALAAVRYADRVGRRPILLVTMAGYGLFTGVSAASTSLVSFAAFQTLAQICIGTEFALAVIVVAEEMPPAERGRAISLLLIASPLGVVATSGLLGAGLLGTALGWRAFYLVGAVPALLVALARRSLCETAAFEHGGGRTDTHRLRTALAPPWRRRILGLGAVSFLQKVPVTAGAGWWVYYAEHERHLSTGLVALDLGIAFTLGTSGYLVCGRAIDRLGRRPVAAAYLIGSFVAGIALFNAGGEAANLGLLVAAVFFGLGIAPALSSMTAEAFPTDIRAGASAIVVNGFATTGEILGPALVGLLGASGGPIGSVGASVSVLALCLIAALPVLALAVPETVGVSLFEDARQREPPAQTSRPRFTGSLGE